MSHAGLKWGIILHGDTLDLEDWREAFPIGFDPYVVSHSDGIAVWTSNLKSTASLAEISETVPLLLAQLNGFMRVFFAAEPLALSAIVEAVADGTETRHSLVRAKAFRSRNRFYGGTVISFDGEPSMTEPKRTLAQEWSEVAHQNDLLTDALTYAAEGENWFSLYKAFECVRKFVEGDEKLKLLLSKSNTEVDRFKHTANVYRHREGGFSPPDRPMTIQQAADYMGTLIRQCIEHLISK